MNLKKIIIILIICIIIVTVILVSILSLNSDEKNYNEVLMNLNTNEQEQNYDELEHIEYGKMKTLKDAEIFFTVKSCIDEYILNNSLKDTEKIYNLLSEEYITENNITTNNVLEKITIYKDEEIFFTIKSIYEYNNNQRISSYFVHGEIVEEAYYEEDDKKRDLYIVVQLDKFNKTFWVIPDERDEINSIGKNLKIKEIKNNEVNVYQPQNIIETQMGMVYFSDYKNKLIENIDDAYRILDKSYKEKRFRTIDEFKNYINLMENLMYIGSVDCKLSKNNENTVYTLKDQYGNTYIFEETAIMEYTVQLDDYTLENEEFNQKYNRLTKKEKGILNIDKFFKMINMKDYTSAYKVLDENFKQNYFKTQSYFENYMKTKIFHYNKVNYKEYSNKITDVYTYKVTLTDMTEENTNEVEFNIVMKILEGTDFIMSFEVN